MKNKREQIIDGLKLLQEECNKIPDNDCHANCPYEDICFSIRAVGYVGIWDFGELKNPDK